MKKLIIILLFCVPLLAQNITTFTIASGDTLSEAKLLRDGKILGLMMPDTGWTSATLSFQFDTDTTGLAAGTNTMSDLYDWDGSQISLTVDAGQFIQLDPRYTVSGYYVRLKASAAQGAEREIKAILWTPEGI